MVEASSWYVFGILQISGSAFFVAHRFTTDGLLVCIRISIRHCITQVGNLMRKAVEWRWIMKTRVLIMMSPLIVIPHLCNLAHQVVETWISGVFTRVQWWFIRIWNGKLAMYWRSTVIRTYLLPVVSCTSVKTERRESTLSDSNIFWKRIRLSCIVACGLSHYITRGNGSVIAVTGGRKRTKVKRETSEFILFWAYNGRKVVWIHVGSWSSGSWTTGWGRVYIVIWK